MQAAQAINPSIATPIDYIMMYQAGYLWAGKPTPPLSMTRCRARPTSAPSCNSPRLPRSPSSRRCRLIQRAGSLREESWRRSPSAPSPCSRSRTILTLSATNGGINLFNPLSAPSYYVGYSSNATPSEILQDLGNTTQQVTMSFSASASSSSSYNISFSGEAGFNWGGDLLDVSASTSWRGDVARAQGADRP